MWRPKRRHRASLSMQARARDEQARNRRELTLSRPAGGAVEWRRQSPGAMQTSTLTARRPMYRSELAAPSAVTEVAGPKDAGHDTPEPGGVRSEYVCPMHPQIVRAEPGSCPICGMALEPRAVGAEEAPNAELFDMRRRFFVSIGPAIIVFLMGMS